MNKHLLKIIKFPRQTSIYEFLYLEEALLRESPHSYILLLEGTDKEYVISGSGNKPNEWLNQEYLYSNHVPVIKRYTGGGSVVVSSETLFVSFVFSKALVPNNVQLFPKPIMNWSEHVYKPVFGEQFKLEEFDYIWKMQEPIQINSNGNNDTFKIYDEKMDNYVGEVLSPSEKMSRQIEELNEELFNFGQDFIREESPIVYKKFGGNAQYVTGGKKQRFCHHTSFLWDFDNESMSKYLKHPNRKPEYRKNRKHEDFLIRLKDMNIFQSKQDFFDKLEKRIFELYQNEWKENVDLSFEELGKQTEYIKKNQYFGTKFINPLTGEQIEQP